MSRSRIIKDTSLSVSLDDDVLRSVVAPSVTAPTNTTSSTSSFVAPEDPLLTPIEDGGKLYNKFATTSSFFSSWIMLEPDASGAPQPIMSESVLLKLKQRQLAFSTRTSNNNAAAVASQSTTAGKQHRRSEESDSDLSILSGDDGESLSGGSMDLPNNNTKEEGQSNLVEDTHGFDGGEDFFKFDSTPSTTGKGSLPHHRAAVERSQLQATIQIPASSSSAVSSSSHRNSSGVWRGTANSASAKRSVVVPLWSVLRYETVGGYCEENASVALHQEITDLVDYLRPTQAEVSLRRMIELQITQMAKSFWPECEPTVYGSLTTQLLLPLSDIDMSILNVPVSTEEALTMLARAIGNAGMCTTAFPQLILKTKVPLLKFQHKGSLLDVDVSINAGDGKRNSDIVKGFLHRFPEAHALILTVKYFLQQRDMHEPYHGGLGSFATTLLVISFLQQHPVYTTRPEERALTGLGKLLVDFFRYYGHCFNYHRCGVSLDDGGFYFLRRGHDGGSGGDFSAAGRVQQVVLEDPGNSSNNAASSLRLFSTIVSAFSHAYAALTAVFSLPDDEEQMTPDSRDIAHRPTLLSRILHVDAESVWRRQCVVSTFDALREDPSQAAFVEEVLRYRHAEDASMLKKRYVAPMDREVEEEEVERHQQLNEDQGVKIVTSSPITEKPSFSPRGGAGSNQNNNNNSLRGGKRSVDRSTPPPTSSSGAMSPLVATKPPVGGGSASAPPTTTATTTYSTFSRSSNNNNNNNNNNNKSSTAVKGSRARPHGASSSSDTDGEPTRPVARKRHRAEL